MNVIDIESFYPFFMNTVFDIHKNKLRKHIIDQYMNIILRNSHMIKLKRMQKMQILYNMINCFLIF